MAITALPTPPTRSDPATFAVRGDAFLAALPTFTAEANALQADVNAKQEAVDAAAAAIASVAAQNALDRAATAADVLQTAQDVIDSGANAAITSINVTATHADVVLTHADVVLTHADAAQTALDRAQTGLDRAQTILDRAATTADLAKTTIDKAATSADAAQTALDRAATAADAAQAALIKNNVTALAAEALASATAASQGAGTVTTKALEALNSAAYAQDHAAAAAASAATATAVVTGGTASPVAGPGLLPLSNAEGGFDATWRAAFMSGAIRPTNMSPLPGQLYLTETPTVTGSAFMGLYSASQAAIQVQVNTTSDFSAPAYSSGDQAAGISFVLPYGVVAQNTKYWWRARYKTVTGAYSEWSEATSFTTQSVFGNDYIYAPTATPAAFGDALEGGYYAGQIWNQLVQASDSKTIATGTLVLTVPSMTAMPICYPGQTLEVRSRANPANKMIGVVTGALGTALTLNITSVGGSGTFADWSVMAQYRVIVVPKSTGEASSRMYKNSNTAAPTACQTVAEGYLATAAMVAAGDASVYPAAWFCKNLNIGGKTDWYLPARDELELCWRNLKPTAANNYITADRFDSGINYKTLGSLDDYDPYHGHNLNSSPAGDAYTTTVPSQVTNALFQTGGAQAFAYGSSNYWSSSEYSASVAWFQYWFSSGPGRQGGNGNKASGYYVRAVRRSII